MSSTTKNISKGAKVTDAKNGQGAPSPVLSREESIAKLGHMIKGIRIAMFTTIDKDGKMTSRPMATQAQDFDGSLWFFTKLDSGKVKCIEHNHHVNVAYSDASTSKFVSVAGLARRVDDLAKKKELWNPMLKAWFPDGFEDPEVALICVDVDSAELWDSPGRLVNLVGMAAAIATGKQFKGIGDNEKIELH